MLKIKINKGEHAILQAIIGAPILRRVRLELSKTHFSISANNAACVRFYDSMAAATLLGYNSRAIASMERKLQAVSDKRDDAEWLHKRIIFNTKRAT